MIVAAKRALLTWVEYPSIPAQTPEDLRPGRVADKGGAAEAFSMRHGKCLGFDFRRAAINSNVFIEIKIRGGKPCDKPSPTTEGQVLNCPLDEDQKAILECHDVHEVDESPDDPGNQA